MVDIGSYYTSVPKNIRQAVINAFVELEIDKKYKDEEELWMNIEVFSDYLEQYAKSMAKKGT